MMRPWLLAVLVGCQTGIEEVAAPAPAAVVEAVKAEVVEAPAPVPAPVIEEEPVPVRVPVPVTEPRPVPEVEGPPPEPVVEPEPVATAADYVLVPRSNALYVLVTYQRGTLGASLAHDHVVVATRYSGTIHWDRADPSACRVAVEVPASGLRVDPPGARAKAGLPGESPEEDKPRIEENFHGRRQLDSGAFPTLTFRSERCVARGDGRFDVTGPLTIHGMSRPTTVTLDITADGGAFTARGRFTASHGDFGMKPFSAAMGAVKNAEPLTFVLDLTGRRVSR